MTQILLSVLTTLGILIGGFNSISFEQTKYLSKEYWLNSSKLGAFTQLASTDQLSAFPTTYNANLLKTIEVGTTSIPTITTLSGLTTAGSLATVGTITAGAWQANTIQSLYGGTGTTSMSQYRVLFGNGTGSTTIATSTGSAGQVFTSSGEAKFASWQDLPPTNVASNYPWTGQHSWSQPLNASSSLTVANKVSISTSTPSQNVNLAVNGGALISGTTTVGNLVATGTVSGIFAKATSTIFTATSTWPVPSGVKRVTVTVVGGGGGGGGSAAAGASRGGGGGGGGYRRGVVDVSGLTNITVNVGSGGIGGTAGVNGNAGGASSFAGVTTITANGGGAGAFGNGTNGTGGAGGTTSGGVSDSAVTGEAGMNGAVLFALTGQDVGGGGGDSVLGFGGNGGDETDGVVGTGYGGGGGGADDAATVAKNGGNGSAGAVIIEWYE